MADDDKKRPPVGEEPQFNDSRDLQKKLVEAYSKSLPKPRARSQIAMGTVTFLGSLGSILGLVFLISPDLLIFVTTLLHIDIPGEQPPFDFKDYYLVFLSVVAITWAVYRTASTPAKTSDTAYYIHRTVHQLRDFLVGEKCNKKDARDLIESVLASAEASFDIMARKKCAISIKIRSGDNLTVKFTSDGAMYPLDNQKAYPTASFSSISSIINSDARSYISNNVWVDFRNGRYTHPLIEDRKVGSIVQSLILMIKESIRPPLSPLGFRSTLVIPIRYIDNELKGSYSEKSPYRYLGFLCIDCRSRGVFRSHVIAETGAIYADILCAIMLHNFHSHGEYV